MAVAKHYLVVAQLPIVIEEGDAAISYNPGDVFSALDSNHSVVRLLSIGHIIETTDALASGPAFVATGGPGPAGPIGPTGPPGIGGEVNTSSSAGGTVALPLAKAGADLPFRGLTAGSGVSLTPSGTDVVIASIVVPGESNTTSSSGGTQSLVLAKSGVDLPFKGLTAGTGITLTPSATDVTIASSGESNTSSSAGGTVALPLAKVGSDLPFRGLTAGSDISLTPTGTDVTINSTVVPGENLIIAQQVFS